MSALLKALSLGSADGAPHYNWKQWLGEELDGLLAFGYLCHTSQKVESLTKLDDFGLPVRYRIVEHSPRDLVAISEEDDRITISAADRMVIRVDVKKLAGSLASATGMDASLVAPVENSSLFLLGTASHPRRENVYVTFSGQEQQVMSDLSSLQYRGIRNANLFLSGAAVATDAVRSMAERNNWELLPIPEYFNLSPETGFDEKADSSVLARGSSAAVDRWMLRRPEKPQWRDVRMRFPEDDNLKVHIHFGGSGRMFEYREILQFTDKRSREPNEQWALLRAFARTSGKLPRIVRGRKNPEQEKLYRRHRTLMKALQGFFGIPTDPFKDVDSETVALFDIGMKGTPSRLGSGEKPEDIGEIFEEISSHDRLHKPAYDSDLD